MNKPSRKVSGKASAKAAARKSFPSWIWIVVAVALIAIAAFALMQPGQQTAEAYPLEVSVAEASNLRNGGAFVLDVREPSEWNELHIPDATLIPLAQLSSRLDEVPKDREVVVVCRSGNRSAQARDILLDAGFTTVTSMAGGMNQWQAQGLPIATGQ